MTRFSNIVAIFATVFTLVACGEEDSDSSEPNTPPACQANCPDNNPPDNDPAMMSDEELRALCEQAKADDPTGMSAALRQECEDRFPDVMEPDPPDPPPNPCEGFEDLAGLWDCPTVDCSASFAMKNGRCEMQCAGEPFTYQTSWLSVSDDRSYFELCIDKSNCYSCTRPE